MMARMDAILPRRRINNSRRSICWCRRNDRQMKRAARKPGRLKEFLQGRIQRPRAGRDEMKCSSLRFPMPKDLGHPINRTKLSQKRIL